PAALVKGLHALIGVGRLDALGGEHGLRGAAGVGPAVERVGEGGARRIDIHCGQARGDGQLGISGHVYSFGRSVIRRRMSSPIWRARWPSSSRSRLPTGKGVTT